ncbi:C-type lectin domain family 18 member A-like [Hyperolius riggenbachi]|uniref:C-type lectin domain family 18 member A-like n=1 Tax=Hyperolius riggenbachi TaxID=752182 RepID=UPI0035A33840
MGTSGMRKWHPVFGILCAIISHVMESSDVADHHPKQKEGLGEKEIFALVSLHNKLRGSVHPPAANMRKMAWSEELESWALAVTSQCHLTAPADPQVGWNMQSFPAGTMSIADVIELWYRQGEDYDFQRAQCATNRTCNLYTQTLDMVTLDELQISTAQLVWATSWQVGCAINSCTSPQGDHDMAVCAYFPGGNWNIRGHVISPYQPGPWCSLCTATWSGCFKYWEQRGALCEVPRNPCRVSCGDYGRLNMSSCQCHCATGYTGLYCQVRCGTRCVHGQYKEDECSCICTAGYGGAECTEKLPPSFPSCDILSDGLCFTLSSQLQPYYRAKKHCQRKGGILAEVTTQKAQDILAYFLAHLEDSNKVTDGDLQARNHWIGLTYKTSFSSFRWDSGEPFIFQSFALGQPDNHGFGNCVEMRSSSGFNWNDQRCKVQNHYICQYKT